MAEEQIDTREFRNAMGTFATGITVLGVNYGGVVRGMTANAFTSLSLRPPLVIVCIDENATMYPVFQVADSFSVNILAHDQEPVSRAFASRDGNKDEMAGLPYQKGKTGSPILDGVLSWADCKISNRYNEGDHMVVIGHVQDFAVARPGEEPLLFFGGKYRTMQPLPPA